MLKSKLIQIGLTEYEANIYTFLLEKGSATAQKIYSATGINRVTTYNVLEGLMKKGLVSSVDTEKKKLFIAESPARLKDFLENKKSHWEQEKKNIEINEDRLLQFLPDLEVTFKSIGEKPSVRFLEGVEGIKNVREEIVKTVLETQSPLYEIFSVEVTREQDKKTGVDYENMKRMNTQLNNANVPSYLIESYTSEKHPDYLRTPNQKFYQVNGNEYPVGAAITVFGNKVSMVSSTGNMSIVIIDNKDVATTMRTLIKLAMKSKENRE